MSIDKPTSAGNPDNPSRKPADAGETRKANAPRDAPASQRAQGLSRHDHYRAMLADWEISNGRGHGELLDTSHMPPDDTPSPPPQTPPDHPEPARQPPPDHHHAPDSPGELTATVDKIDFRDPLRRNGADRYGTPLNRLDGTRTPLFNGEPTREQTKQGASSRPTRTRSRP